MDTSPSAAHLARSLRVLAIAVVMLTVTSCMRDVDGTPPTESARPVRSEVPGEPVPSSSVPAITGEVPAGILDAILAEVADRSGLPVDDLEVTRAEAMTFSDGSLDCPEPGMAYTQALVDGYRVEIEAGGESFDYRVGAGGSFRRCESGGRPADG